MHKTQIQNCSLIFGKHQLMAESDVSRRLEIIVEMKFNQLKDYYNGRYTKRKQEDT